MIFFIENIKNKLDFFLRNKFSLSRKNYREKNENKQGIFKTDSAIEREKYLYETYDLNELKNNSTRLNYMENLYVLDLLDRYFNNLNENPQPQVKDEQTQDSENTTLASLTPTLSLEGRGGEAPPQDAETTSIKLQETKILDIGCKNWFYARGEYFFFKKHLKNFKLDGIELDANRVCTNFFSRKEIAKYHIKNLENTNYIAGDYLNHIKSYDFIIWILPFVFKYPHLKWGLPLSHFKPEKMLNHAYNSLNGKGTIFIINQGEAEFEHQQKLCKNLKIPFNPIGEIKSEFISYKIKRYLTIIQK